MTAVTETVQQNIQAAQPTIETLESLNPKALILRVKCEKCSHTFTHDVAFVLKMTRKTGFFIPSPLCPDCRSKKRRPSTKQKADANNKEKKKSTKKALKPVKKPKAKTESAPTVEKKVKAPSTAPKEQTMLTHRPFAVLKDLKTEK